MKTGTIMFVSHDTASVKSLCSRALLLDSGCSQFMGDVNTAVEKYYSSLVSQQRNERNSEFHTNTDMAESDNFTYGDENFQSMAKFQRIQNGAAEFLNVMILDEKGQSIDAVTFGQKVTLRQIIRANRPLQKLGLAYHIRDKNGQDIIYSDTGLESENHIQLAKVGSVYVVDWSFTAYLREGNYVIASMASEPIDLNVGSVVVLDFIPISVRFSLSRGKMSQIYAAAYWKNEVNVQEIKYAK